MGSSFQTISSTRFDLSFPMPDAGGFQIDDRTERWLVATHPATSSTLHVRTWREYELMNRQTCEDRARLFRQLPERNGAMVIEQRRIDVPPDHDTIVEVRVHVGTKATEGSVLAFGAWARRCFAFVFTTRDDHERTVVARLSTIRHGTLARMRFESELVAKRKPPNFTGR